MIDSSLCGWGCSAAKPRRVKKHERLPRASDVRAPMRRNYFGDARRGFPSVQPRPHNSATTQLHQSARLTGGPP
jgi:hypothetical protein